MYESSEWRATSAKIEHAKPPAASDEGDIGYWPIVDGLGGMRTVRISAFNLGFHEMRERPRKRGFSRIRSRLQTPSSPSLRRKSPKVSGLLRGNSRFAETIGEDWFDRDCHLTVSVRGCHLALD